MIKAKQTWLGPFKSCTEALNELRKSTAEILGHDPKTWPTHGNAPLAISASLALLHSAVKELQPSEWQPISDYDREKGAVVVLLDWFTYRTDPTKKLNPVRYVGSWSEEYQAWFDDDGMDLDIEPTHWLPLPNVPEGGR